MAKTQPWWCCSVHLVISGTITSHEWTGKILRHLAMVHSKEDGAGQFWRKISRGVCICGHESYTATEGLSAVCEVSP